MRITERCRRLMPNGVPRWIRCYVNEAEANPFVVLYTGRYTHKTERQHLAVNCGRDPFWPQGYCVHVETPVPLDSKRRPGRRIRFEDLPREVKDVVLVDYVYLWDIGRRWEEPPSREEARGVAEGVRGSSER